MKPTSFKNNLNTEEWEKWAKNTLLFSTPAILAVLLALQSGQNVELAVGAGYSALLAAVIDLIKKYRQGA